MRYDLQNGYSVHTADFPGGTEFETQNPAGDTVSVVRLRGAEASDLMISLHILNCLKGRR